MPLRPVSELGLVDVTDAAGPETAATKPAAPARPRSRRAAKTADRPKPAPQATTGASRRSLPAGISTSALSGAIGLAGSVLLARAVLQRDRRR